VERVIARLAELKSLGVRIAIDDFGIGYSSLSYLRFLPVDVLKIDRSFVNAVDSGAAERAVVRSIVSLSQILGLRTVAEGIETTSQLDALRTIGAHLGQGYLFARPLSAVAMSRYLARHARAGRAVPPRTVTARTGRKNRQAVTKRRSGASRPAHNPAQ
jgi:EAL domain-containing protein (putative c-di-GMP-specific phosphodiesterase class I)